MKVKELIELKQSKKKDLKLIKAALEFIHVWRKQGNDICEAGEYLNDIVDYVGRLESYYP